MENKPLPHISPHYMVLPEEQASKRNSSFKKSSGGKSAWSEERRESYSCRRPADLFLR
jgi:hypothetical protein